MTYQHFKHSSFKGGNVVSHNLSDNNTEVSMSRKRSDIGSAMSSGTMLSSSEGFAASQSEFNITEGTFILASSTFEGNSKTP